MFLQAVAPLVSKGNSDRSCNRKGVGRLWFSTDGSFFYQVPIHRQLPGLPQ